MNIIKEKILLRLHLLACKIHGLEHVEPLNPMMTIDEINGKNIYMFHYVNTTTGSSGMTIGTMEADAFELFEQHSILFDSNGVAIKERL